MAPEPPDIPSADAQRNQINTIRIRTEALARRQLISWTIRWLIGFGIVAYVTFAFDAYYWLWPVAIGMAGLSLGFTLYYRRKLRQRFDDADKTADRLDEALKQFEETSAPR